MDSSRIDSAAEKCAPPEQARCPDSRFPTDAYEAMVYDLINSNSNRVISNEKSEHAAILYCYFFKYARKNVLIFCKNLSRLVFERPEVLQSATEALSRGVTFKVVTQEDPESTEFLSVIKKKGGLIEQNSIRKLENSRIKINFSVIDNRRYRYERDHNAHEAVACMNDGKTSVVLADLFEKLNAAASKFNPAQ